MTQNPPPAGRTAPCRPVPGATGALRAQSPGRHPGRTDAPGVRRLNLSRVARAVHDEAEITRAAVAELEAQVAGFMAILQSIQRNQALNFTKEQSQDTLRLQAGLQLLAQLLMKLGKGGWTTWKKSWLTKPQALQFGTVEVNCVGLGRCFHKRMSL